MNRSISEIRNVVAVNSVFAGLLVAAASPAIAGNGMYLIGYGNESSLMGGADVAVARDAFAANNNPAGMTQIEAQAVDIEVAPFYNWGTNHTDAFGNYRKPFTNGTSLYGNGAYARRLDKSPYAAGVALVIQGGVGWVYSGLNTVFGTRDDAGSMFTIVKLAPAFAWQVNDQLSVGAALGINYLAGTQELFPNTSSPGATPSTADDFRGFRFNGASGIGLTTKLGLQYRPAPDVTIGATYGTRSSIPLKNGYMRINFTNTDSPGLGVVRYDNAELRGMALPEEFALGIAFRPIAPLLVSVQGKHYRWSKALASTTLVATHPRDPAAPATVSLPGALDASDQDVFQLGFAYDHDQNNTFYAGYNRGRRILPDRNLSPIFALIYSTHYTLGFNHKLDKEWQAGAGVEVYPPKSVTYDSPLFGARANEHHNGAVVHLSLARRW